MDNTHFWEFLCLQSEFTRESLCNDCFHIYLENLTFHCCFLPHWSSLVAHRAPGGFNELISPPLDLPSKLLQLVAHTTASALSPEAFKEASLLRPGFLIGKKEFEGRNYLFFFFFLSLSSEISRVRKATCLNFSIWRLSLNTGADSIGGSKWGKNTDRFLHGSHIYAQGEVVLFMAAI